MSGNLCRCAAYPNILAAIKDAGGIGMKPFTYERATDVQAARPRRCRPSGCQVHRRRHQPDRPDEDADRDAGPSGRREPPAAREDRGGRWRPAHRRAGPQQRAGRRPPGARALSGAERSAARRRLGPAAQQGDDRRQPAAADALLLLLQLATCPATNASPARAARRCRASTASTRSSARAPTCIAVHPSDMAVAHDGAGRHGRDALGGRQDRATIPLTDFHTLPGTQPRGRDRAAATAS